MASAAYHEALELLSGETREMHRAIVSLTEELEAIDWYQQRVDACSDPQLKDVLLHNKNEEIEHASMLMEWIRRHNDHFSEMMRSTCSLSCRSLESRKPQGQRVLAPQPPRGSASAA